MTSENPGRAAGIALFQRGDLPGAEKALRDALRNAPGEPDLLAPLAVCLQAMGRPREAFDSFMQALNTDPDFVPALLGAGQMIARTGQAEKALEFLERAARLAPDNWPVAGARIEVLVNNGRTADATTQRSSSRAQMSASDFRVG